ncbi:MAG: 2-phosphosulfolactate phosphatase [Thermoanaerobacteraceae bacterium]|nr:2-phosphosulfolactate phosphatase [Thermoanaerobacteraceae bacterium]
MYKIDVVPVAQSINPEDLAGRTAVVFDVLRATSTIVTALAHGCRAVAPVVEVQQARQMAAVLEGEGIPVLLAGERGGRKVDGFPHGNSPLEFPPEVAAGKTLVLTTSNGTRALAAAARGARAVLVGSLLNARAVAGELLRLGQDITLVCAGSEGRFSLEDTLAAGMVVQELVELISGNRPEEGPLQLLPLDLSDLAVTALHLARAYRDNLRAAFDHSRHGRRLAAMGLADDLDWCARLNAFPVVPEVKPGEGDLLAIVTEQG